ncbi:MAG: hypothetical protein AB1925_05420 [Actinomycetota bacterium]
MPKSVRPWLTVAVATLGVGVMPVASTQSVSKSELRVENTAATRTVTQSPLQYYPEVLTRSLTNAGHLAGEYFDDPLPVVRAIADSQHRAVVGVLRAAAELDPEAFAHATFSAMNQPVASLGRVVGSGEPFQTGSSLLVRLAVPAASGVLAGGASAAEVVDAATDLDPVRVATGLVNLPARTVDGLLNGRVDGQHDEYFGLLGSVVEAPVSDELSGPVDYLIHSLRDIGDMVAAPPSETTALAEPAAAPDLDDPTPAVQADAGTDDAPADEHPTRRAESRDGGGPSDDDKRTPARAGATARHRDDAAATPRTPRHPRGTATDGASA